MQEPITVNGSTIRISSPFGPRRSGFHAGIDYQTPEGTPVSASGSGTIVRASHNSDFGNVIVIDHGTIGPNGEHVYSLYAHLIEMNVNLGDTVSAGQVIGGSGGQPNTDYSGRSDGPHLHFEVVQSPNGVPLEWRTTGSMGYGGKEFRIEPKKYFDEALTVVPTRVDPLIFDLDGDGIETLHVKDGAYFDHDGNGFAEQTGWAAPDDGLLVMDRNADGIINDGKELFGDQTILKNNTRAENSFQAVADIDDNLDGKIDINDAAFSQLRVWKDEDADGHSTAGELYSLDQLGITAINTGYTSTNVTDTNGNTQVQAGTFEKAGGATGQMGSFQVQRDTTYTIANELMVVPAEIETLPDLQGTGNVYDLHQTIVRDTSGQLRTLVEQFNASTDVTMRNSLMEEILFKWTGADSIDPNSRGVNIDARRLDVLEKFFGMGFTGVNGSDPNANAGALLDQSYEGMFEMYYAQLMAQTHLKDFYGIINYSWDGISPSAKGSVSNVITQINTMLAADYSTGVQALTEFTRTLAGQKGWEVMTDFQEFRDQFANYGDDIEWYLDSTGKDILAGTGANDSISGTINADAIKGKGGNDILFGNTGDDTLYGGDGNDSLYGEDGADIMNGGAGNDNMEGRLGSDTYIFNPGSGQDTIVDNDTSGSIDRIEFGVGISSSDIELVKGTNLTINIKGTTDTLKIGNWFSSTNPNDYRIEEFEFSDGSVLSIADLEAIGGYKIYGSSYGDTLYGTDLKDEIYGYDGGDFLYGYGGDDTIYGGNGYDTIFGGDGNDLLDTGDESGILFGENGNDILNGGSGNDTLYGGEGNDTLSGGAGSDNLNGEAGSDTYIFNPGSGQDTIIDYDTSGGIDRIEFGVGISSGDLELVKETNLIINIKGTTDSLKIGNWFNSTNPNDYRIEEFKFSDGSVLSIADLEVIGGYKIYGTNSYGDTLYGTDVKDEIYGYDGGDFLYGYGGDDSIYGGNGFDWIYGGDGNDLLDAGDETGILYGENGDDILNGGSGNDTLYGGDGNDVLSGGADFDYLYGETGDDTYIIDDTLYSMTESVDGGIDTVKSSISFTLGANVENLTLTGTDTINATGNTLNNILTGNSSSNTIDGGAGADSMSGGAGDDTYIVETTGDTVIETTGEGTDIVESSITCTLGANVENLLLTGNSAINGTGNSLNNLITGNNAANVLKGGWGNDTINGGSSNDTMIGGKGNDTYVVDNAGDVVSEAVNEGTDKVWSLISYTLGANIENLTLTGSAAIDGTGNSLNNSITGSSMANMLIGEDGNDTLSGLAGIDTLDGGIGNDSLNGGKGGDTYIFSQGYGQDTINDYSSDSATTTDIAQINTIPLDLIFSQSGNNLDVSINGTTDQITIQNWYSGAAYQTEEFKTSDGGKLINTQIDQLIQTMAVFSADTGMSWSEAIQQRPQDVQTILAQYWEPGGQP